MIYRTGKAGLLAGAAFVACSVAGARAETTVAVTATCPATGPAIAICATAGVALFELVQMANGKEGFGPNGELMRIIAAPVKIVDGNVRSSERERGAGAKVLRAVLRISERDILEHGIFGGPNSILRKPFG